MLTALDAPLSALDPDERSFVSKVREHGWFGTNVLEEADHPGFSYTTGFWVSTQQPELILFGLRGETAHDICWNLYRDGKAARSLPVGKRTEEVFANNPAFAFPVARKHYPDHLGWTRWFYGNDAFPCLQIVWPDRSGLFPWDRGCDPKVANSQPDLTEKGWRASLAH